MLKTFAMTFSAVLLVGSFAFALEGVLPTPAPTTAFGPTDALAEAAKYDMGCNGSMPPTADRISISFKYSYDTPTDPTREQAYWVVTCAAGAYNENSVLLREDYDGVLRPVPLAVPQLNNKGKLVGFTAEIVNGVITFDPKTEMITTFSKGRGVGDLFNSGSYQLFETQVILREYTIDNKPGEQYVPPIVKFTQELTR